jgi:hypothetical protein
LWELIFFRNHTVAWCGIWCNDVILYNNTRWFNLWFIKECYNEHFPCFLRFPFWRCQTTEVNNDTLITKTDRTGKREFWKICIFFSKKRQNNCEELNTRFHAKFLAVILKNPYYTPCTAHIITPPCNTDQVITPLGYMTCCISNLSHRQN